MAIKVFGKEASQIEKGEKFIAFTYSVEGRRCVELIPERFVCPSCNELMKDCDLGHDDSELLCVNENCKDRSC